MEAHMAYLITSKAERRTGEAESLNIPFKDTQLQYLNLPHYTVPKGCTIPQECQKLGAKT